MVPSASHRQYEALGKANNHNLKYNPKQYYDSSAIVEDGRTYKWCQRHRAFVHCETPQARQTKDQRDQCTPVIPRVNYSSLAELY